MSLEDWERHMQTDEDVLPEESVWTSSAAHSRDAPLVKGDPEEPHDGGTGFAARVALRLLKKLLIAVWRVALFVLHAPYKGITNIKVSETGGIAVGDGAPLWWSFAVFIAAIDIAAVGQLMKGVTFELPFTLVWLSINAWVIFQPVVRLSYKFIVKPLWTSSKNLLTKTMAEVAAEDLKKKNKRFKPG